MNIATKAEFVAEIMRRQAERKRQMDKQHAGYLLDCAYKRDKWRYRNKGILNAGGR